MHQSLKLLRNPVGYRGYSQSPQQGRVYHVGQRLSVSGRKYQAAVLPVQLPGLGQDFQGSSGQRDPVLPSGLHPRRRDLPGRGLHLHLLPHGQTDLTGPGSGQDQELEGEPSHPVGGGLPDLSQCIRHVAIGQGRVVALQPGNSGQGPGEWPFRRDCPPSSPGPRSSPVRSPGVAAPSWRFPA